MMPAAEPTAALTRWTEADLWALCDAVPAKAGTPGLVDVLRMALDHEATHPDYPDWEWHDIHTWPATLNKCIIAGIARKTSGGRSPTYRLNDPERVAAALAAYRPSGAADAEVPTRPSLPADAFVGLSGRDDEIALLRLALSAASPVHVLLVGSPGGGKSLLLDGAARCPGATQWLGGTTSRAGLRDLILAQAAGPVLVIDELDTMGAVDQSVLLSVMESGRLTVLQSRRQETLVRPLWVMAGTNTTRGLSKALLDRFQQRHVPDYRPEQLRQVMADVLAVREGWEPDFAQELATLAQRHTSSVREAVRVGRLCGGDRAQLPEVARLVGWA